MNSKDTVRPPVSYYWFAAPFLVLGIGLFAYTLIHGIFHITDALTQVVVPGDADLSLKKGISYTVFLEENSVVDGKIYTTVGSIGGLTCSAKSKSLGDSVLMRHASSSVTYNLGSRSGRSVLEFSVPEDGVYAFGCAYPDDKGGPQTVVAVGSGVGKKIVKLVFTCLGFMFGGCGLATCVFFAVLLLRERAKKALATSMQPVA